MNRLNLAGQNVLSNTTYTGFKEKGKPSSNGDTPNSQYSQYNQKYYNQSGTQLESTFSSMANQNTPMSHRQSESSDLYRQQKLSQIVNGQPTASPIPISKISQLDQTASSNMSGLTSSYFSAIGMQKPPTGLSNFNKTERNYFQQIPTNQQLDSIQDFKDTNNSLLNNTQQRFIYSRNGSEKTLSTNTFYPQMQHQQSTFSMNTKNNLDTFMNLQNESKISINPQSTKYKVRSCVNMKSSTKLTNGELTFLSQVQAVNDQILNTPNPNESYLQKKIGDDTLILQNNTTPISTRKENQIYSASNLYDLNSMSSRFNQNTSSLANFKQIDSKKDIVNPNNEILIESKLNLSQFKDASKILNGSIQSERNTMVFQQNGYSKSLLEQQSSSTLKNVFYQQLAANSHITKNRKEEAKNIPFSNKSSTNLHSGEGNKNFNTPAIDTRKRTQSKFDYTRDDYHQDSDEDRRMYEELLDMSPLPKTRKNEDTHKANGLIQIQVCKPLEEADSSQIDINQRKRELSRNQEERENFNTENAPVHSATSISGAYSDRNIRIPQTIEQNKTIQKSSHGISTPNLSKQINISNKKGISNYVSDATILEQAKDTKKFANNYKKINHIIDEVKHFKDKLEVGQAMLTTTMTKNILPRKLGIVANINANQKSINDALKKRKKRQSFDANGSPVKVEQKGELPALLASQKGKRVSEFMYNTNLDSSDEKPKNQLQQNSSQTPQNPKTYKSSTPVNSKSSNTQPESILKRGSSHSQHLKKAPSRVLNYNNGLIESETRKFDKVQFKDSNEVATYLQRNLQVSKSMEDENEEKINLNLSRLQISKTYCEMLAQALKHQDFEKLNSLNLQDNNLTGSALLLISQNLPKYIRKLDLSNNFLNSNDANSICNILNCSKYVSLISLNLSNNLLTDVGLKAITNVLSKNSNLLSLYLSHNKLTDLSSANLKEILLQNSGLQEIYLSWNKISSKSGIDLAAGLSNNFNIKVLDLSHNCLGQNPNLHCGKKIIESCSKLESGLIHIDLSYNLFTKPECQEIAAALAKNKKIYGFHFEGNESHATVDTRGFVYFPDEDEILQKHVSTHTLMRRDIRSVKCLGINKLQNFNCNVTDNCWICDGWQEIEFELKEGSNEAFLCEPAFLHLDFEDFKPMYMDRDPADPSRFFLRRMCPPNRRILFFFTNPCTKLLFESNDYEKVDFHVNEQNLAIYEDEDETPQQEDQSKDQNFSAHHLQHSKQRKFNVKYLDGTVSEYIVPTTVNSMRTKLHKNINKNKGDYEILVKCLPRQEETYFKINFTNQWHRGISLFKSFQADTPEIEQKCFEDDWNNCKLQQILQFSDKNIDLNECKKIILNQYPQIRVLYRYLSCFGVVNDVFCVTLSPFTVFAQQSKIIDNVLMRMRDLECIFIAASSKALKVKNYRAPEKSLTRSEFIEVMGRLAIDKYIRTKTAKTTVEALNFLLNNQNFQKHIAEYEDPQKWRNIRYWTKQCDEMMKRYLNFIKSLWNEYADSRKGEKRGGLTNQKTMNLQEFQDMVNEFNLKDQLLTERDVIMSFNLSLMSIIDEINSDKYMAMTFVEFLEGLARLAEFKSRTPVGERDEAYQDDEKVQIRLEYKIESLLENMSVQYGDVMKIKRKKQMMMQKQIQQRNSTRMQSLKVRKSFIQYSQPELEDESGINKFATTVQRVMNTMSVINAFKDKNHSNSSIDEADSKSQKGAFNSLTTQSEISKNNQLHRIDSENDEFEDENSFSMSIKKKKTKQISQIIEFNHEDESRPLSLKDIDDSN